MKKKNISVIIAFFFLMQIYPGGLCALQDYQGDVCNRLEQEQSFLAGPSWVIPSTFNPKKENIIQERQDLLRASDRSAYTAIAKEESEPLPLIGPKGGSSQPASAKTGGEAQDNGAVPFYGETWEEVVIDDSHVERTRTVFFTKDGRSYMTETFINDELVEKRAVIYLDQNGSYIALTASSNGDGTYTLEVQEDYAAGYPVMGEPLAIERGSIKELDYSATREITNKYYGQDAVGHYDYMGFTEALSLLEGMGMIDSSYMCDAAMSRIVVGSFTLEHIDNKFKSVCKLAYVPEGNPGEPGPAPITGMREAGAFVPRTINTSLRPALTGYGYLYPSETDMLNDIFSDEEYALAAPSAFNIDGQSSMREEGALYDEAMARASKFTNIQNIKYIESAVKARLQAETTPADIIAELSLEKELTDTEASLLEASQAVVRDDEYIDDETMKSFTEAAYYVRIAESMKDVLDGVDFDIITEALDTLVKEHSGLYGRFLSLTKDAYDEVARLLALKADDGKMPGRYECLSNLDAKMKVKILADIRLRELMEKDISRLNENEKKAVKIYNDFIKQFRDEYKREITRLLDKFTFEVKKAIINAEGATATEEGGQFKALFLLGHQSK